MSTETEIVNRALQVIGTRTTVTEAELAAASTNEAIQAVLAFDQSRDDLVRIAPWNFSTAFMNLVYITSLPGTPRNLSPATQLWAPGQPPPPWVYEYQYPVDCLRPLWIIPQIQTGYVGSVPLTPATYYASYTQQGAVPYKVVQDRFYQVQTAAVVAGGTGYAFNDVITLPYGAVTSPPIGAPAKLQVATVAAGVILTVTVVNQVRGNPTPKGGSYFARQTGTIAQSTTTGVGTGATFTLAFGPQFSERVIVTNQENPVLAYVRQIDAGDDLNITDTMFQRAWINLLAARLCMALTGEKNRANELISFVNVAVEEARKADGNEGLTVNDIAPDWLTARGVTSLGNSGWGFDWGPLFPTW